METIYTRIKDGREFDRYFSNANFSEITVKKNADLSDTQRFIPKVVRQTAWQTVDIASLLQGETLMDTCKKVFDFTHDHISYHKDEDKKEQIRSPRRSWADRKRGIDCDDYTVFIASILYNLGIPVTLRVAKYSTEKGFQHIYPMVPLDSGKYIILDPVIHVFNYEKTPILEKIDQKMDLNFLDGTAEDDFDSAPEQFDHLFGLGGQLGKGISLKRIGKGIKKVAKKVSIKNALNVINKVNPATVLLRNGLLACMKINLMKVAGNLRWTYLSDAQAQQKGILLDRLNKLRSIRKKLEDIFFGAGGKVENLKKAILNGKGNNDRAVAGLGYVDEESTWYDGYTPLSTLLGEIYYSENDSQFEELGQLGEPGTAAAIAAASGAVATISALIKAVGSLFPPGQAPANESGEEESSPSTSNDSTDEPVNTNVVSPFNKLIQGKGAGIQLPEILKMGAGGNIFKNLVQRKGAGTQLPLIPKSGPGASFSTAASQDENDMEITQPAGPLNVSPTNTKLPIPAAAPVGPVIQQEQATSETDPTPKTASPEGSFWDRNKSWIQPTAIGLGLLTVVILGAKALSGNKPPKENLEGVQEKKPGRPKGSKNKKKIAKVALL